MPHTPVDVPGLTLLARRGAGSTGEVFSARRDGDGWPCAVKIVGVTGADRFAALREIDVLTAVRAPGLVRLYDVLSTSDGRLAMVLDLVDGGILRDVVADRGRLDLRETAGVLRAVLEALAALHARGIAHGDVSAANVLVARDGKAVLGDLGSARLAGESLSEVCATHGFTAPEVMLGGQPTPAADVYAVGALAWLMVTGSVPTTGHGRRTLAELSTDCPAALSELVDRCLSGDPASRPRAAHALEFCRELGPDAPLPLRDGPDLGGRLTHRLRSRVEELAETQRHTVADSPHAQDLQAVLAGMPAPGAASSRPGRLADGRAAEAGLHRRGDIGARDRVVARMAALSRSAAARTAGAILAGAAAGLLLWWGASATSWLPVPDVLRLSWGRAAAAASPPVQTPAAPASTGSASAPPASNAAPASGGGASASSASAAPAGASAGAGDPVAALPTLLAARASAYAQANPAPLADCYLRSSHGLMQATAEVEALRQARTRYVGLAYQVSAARLMEGSDEDHARVRARVATGAYRVVVSGDRATQRAVPPAGAAGLALVYVLHRQDGHWRLAAVDQS